MGKMISPKDCNTDDKLHRIPKSFKHANSCTIIVGVTSVSLISGFDSRHEAMVNFPKSDFDKLVSFYLRKQKVLKRYKPKEPTQ